MVLRGLISGGAYNRDKEMRSETCQQKTILTLVFSLFTQNVLALKISYRFTSPKHKTLRS